MIAELVKIKVPAAMNRNDVLAAAREAAAGWRGNPDLLRKHFLLDDQGYTYGFYLWTSRSAAETAHGDAFQARVREKFGCAPEFSYFDVLLNLDNLTDTISEGIVATPGE
ncbi:MAG: hypothetical protein K9K30_09665 [Burkholderiaceae bacterium]|nr:hypothetical protein [Sulfuritalea sp.]MCF8175493.1 hypothetical protein [Burkholderiaceae bacterium]